MKERTMARQYTYYNKQTNTKTDMKKYFKFIVAAIIALIFIGTFVFLYV